ncbi:CLUMA_CG009757, isoform A [Clunio marinus]|uniref:CLUMA_CG009757, isoform A n=1 Tax=Clunio marinus TaxID=568069 RepID=A0A1J1I9C7_9DIPT|nr:CLUMA_CG009757, isoform A [Clunio marinus]
MKFVTEHDSSFNEMKDKIKYTTESACIKIVLTPTLIISYDNETTERIPHDETSHFRMLKHLRCNSHPSYITMFPHALKYEIMFGSEC